MNVQVDGPAVADVITGRSPSCAQPIVVTLLRIDGADDGRRPDLLQPDRIAKYIYLGAVMERPDTAALTARYAGATIRFVLGLRTGKPSASMAMVALPRACPRLATVNWSALSPAN